MPGQRQLLATWFAHWDQISRGRCHGNALKLATHLWTTQICSEFSQVTAQDSGSLTWFWRRLFHWLHSDNAEDIHWTWNEYQRPELRSTRSRLPSCTVHCIFRSIGRRFRPFGDPHLAPVSAGFHDCSSDHFWLPGDSCLIKTRTDDQSRRNPALYVIDQRNNRPPFARCFRVATVVYPPTKWRVKWTIIGSSPPWWFP